MAYCPKCRSEYPDGVRECLDCHITLHPGRRPGGTGLDLEDTIVPAALAVGFVVSTALLAVRVLVDAGRLTSPVATVIANTQPPCLSAVFAIGSIASAILLAVWVARTLFRL